MPASPQNSAEHTRSRYDLFAPLYVLAEWPMEHLLFRPWREALWREVSGPRVSELGVGTGQNIFYYPPHVGVAAIDLSPKMLQRARCRADEHAALQVHLAVQDAHPLEFTNDSFGEVVVTFVFCSVPDPVHGLPEALWVTRPGGYIHLLQHVWAETELLGRLMDQLDAPVHWLTGVHIASRTVENERRVGRQIDGVTLLSRFAIFRRIKVHKPV